jgi:lipopolysaccharide export system permease protein
MLKQLWQRYLFSELLKVFFLFLCCFFFLYCLIDYSLHMQDFLVGKKMHFSHLFTYYFYQFIKRADLLIPLALLIATIKVLLTLNMHGELVALQASGLSARKILRPFFFLALLSMLFNCASAELLLPSSLHFLDQFREQHFKRNRLENRKEPIHVIFLKDRSKIVYQKKIEEKDLLFDVFWIRSASDIWRMKYLSFHPENPQNTDPRGYFVDHIVRACDGTFEKVESFESHSFPSFHRKKEAQDKGGISIENRKPSELFYLLTHKKATTAFEYPQILAFFLHKCLTPLLSFLVVIAVAPFCFQYSRSLPQFFIYTLSLFLFIAYTAFIDAALILGETQVLSPYIVLLLPFTLTFLGFGFRFIRRIPK